MDVDKEFQLILKDVKNLGNIPVDYEVQKIKPEIRRSKEI